MVFGDEKDGSGIFRAYENFCENLELAMMRQVAEELRMTLGLHDTDAAKKVLPIMWLGLIKDGKSSFR